jgi:hypothetical protein
MSNALEAASLIMVPSGYENGTLASVKPNDGTGDFTFSRGSNLSATRINEQGYIEKGYENLLLQSNSFLTTWIKSNASVTGGQVGYDGTNDAWLLEKTASSGVLIKYQTLNITHCFNVYAKAGTLNWIRIRIGTSGDNAYFNLDPNAAGSRIGAFTDDSAQIEDIGNGWFRCSVSYSGVADRYRIYPADDAGDVSGTTGSIYIQDAMLNQGLVPYPYIETTTASVAGGILEDEPRLDWASGSPSLLLEPSRTNLLTHSEYYNGWTQSGTTLTTNTTETLSPEGLYNASKLVGNGTTGVINSGIAKTGIVGVSVYLKSVSGSVNVTFKDPYGVLANEVKSVTTEWQRFDFIGDNGLSFAGFWIDDIPASGIYMWGAQLEQGSYPTSYIPTYGVSQTRLQDSCNVSGLAQSFPFTAYIEIDVFSTSVYNQFQFRQDASNHVLRLGNTIRVGTAALSNTNTLGSNKFALSVDAFGNFELFKNSTSLGTGTITQIIDEIRSDAAGYEVKEIILFPTALSDEECIQLTTV